ncbi:hypothetical protein APHAL10511_001700 [Amanita phalloides]|nr:hypothetical protein APHAL10511_001700 [Amanita phalloides]
MAVSQKPRCKHLVLDAGPLLSLTPLRGLAESFYTVPQVLAELKDKRAREHLEQLRRLSGVNIVIKSPDAASLAHVIELAKKTGDYSVLSHPDLSVLALVYMLHKEGENTIESRTAVEAGINEDVSSAAEGSIPTTTVDDVTERLNKISFAESPDGSSQADQADIVGEGEEPLDFEIHPIQDEDESASSEDTSSAPVFEDPTDVDDGEGDWITPDNVHIHKSKALGLLPSATGKDTKYEETWAGCMTVDFAMQNVLLQMGLNLISIEGKRIEKMKTWILRCHACFELCKDNSKKFCPSCGNPTLIRVSVTLSKLGADPKAPAVQVHLQKNFQYRLRGTKYCIPAPKSGSAKTGSGDGLILREDQQEYMRAVKRIANKKERQEAKMLKGMANSAAGGSASVLSSWMDPDWVPEMMSTRTGGKSRNQNPRPDELPRIGYGNKNPNERRRRK